MKLSQDGKYACFSKSNRLILCNTDNGETFEFAGMPVFDYERRFLANDTLLVRIAPNGDGNNLYHLPEQKPWLTHFESAVSRGEWIATQKGRTVSLYTFFGDTAIWNFNDCDSYCFFQGGLLGVSHCERTSADNSRYRTRVYDLKTGTLLKTFDGWEEWADEQGRFSYFCTRDVSVLWQLQPEFKELRSFHDSNGSREIHGGRLYRISPLSAMDPFTGECLWTRTDVERGEFSPDDRCIVCDQNSSGRGILDARDGTELFRFAPSRWSRGNPSGQRSVLWSADSNMFLTFEQRPYEGIVVNGAPAVSFTVWKLRRPWQWYGFAWLPEFWLTMVFGVGLVWSICRDRRMA